MGRKESGLNRQSCRLLWKSVKFWEVEVKLWSEKEGERYRLLLEKSLGSLADSPIAFLKAQR